MSAEPVLELSGITVNFGAINVLSDVDLSVERASSVGLVGPNGAGKTTLLNVASGFVNPRSGRITLGHEDVTRMQAPQRARNGLGRTFQTAVLFDGLSLQQNLRTASRMSRKKSGGADLSERDVLRLTWLEGVADQRVERLTNFQRRLAEVARTLMLAPTVLMLDEPASGLREAEVEQLADLLNRLRRDRGLSTVIVSHDMPMVRSCCSTVVVLDEGCVIATGSPEVVLQQASVIEAYLGTDESEAKSNGR